MLDEYQTNQPIIYKILKNAVSKDKTSHAYLFETNGFYDSYNLIMAFVKAVLCPNKYTNNNHCDNCQQCHVIDSGNFPEIKIIKPDGLWIKKEEMQNLQEEFSKKALIGNKKIYIIKEADKLNKQSANSILKFLEEPEEGIIAILLTENIYNVLETIRSRCQILRFKEDNKIKNVNNTLSKIGYILYEKNELTEEETEQIQKILKFIQYYEENHLDTILYMQKLFHDNVKTKEDLERAFNLIILFYKDILNYMNNNEIDIFVDYESLLNKIASKNTLNDICYKIKTLTEFKEKIKYNANTFLLMDKLILALERR